MSNSFDSTETNNQAQVDGGGEDLSPRDVNLLLGRNLRRLRESLGLSQRELAKRAGLTNSSISTVEQGLVSPSVQSLERILAAFPLSLSAFFRWQEKAAPAVMITREDLLSTALHPALGVIQQPLSQCLGACVPGVDMQRLQVLDGAEVPLACAPCGDVLLTQVSGQLVLHMVSDAGHAPLLLAPGDAVRIPAGNYYRLVNPYAQAAELLLASLLLSSDG